MRLTPPESDEPVLSQWEDSLAINDIENVIVSACKYSQSQRTAANTREPKALQSGTSSTSVNITEPNGAAWQERSQGFEPP
jgi:hypothetical protein